MGFGPLLHRRLLRLVLLRGRGALGLLLLLLLQQGNAFLEASRLRLVFLAFRSGCTCLSGQTSSVCILQVLCLALGDFGIFVAAV
jgi:hypothetical protein